MPLLLLQNAWRNGKRQFAFGLAIFSLLAGGAYSYRAMLERANKEVWVLHTYEVLRDIQDLSISMRTLQSSTLGYALTGESLYLREFGAATTEATKLLTAIEVLTLDNERQQPGLGLVRGMAGETMKFGELVIRLRQTRGRDAAEAEIRSGRSDRTVHLALTLTAAMSKEEERLLELRLSAAKSQLAKSTVVLILATGFSLLIASAAGLSVHRENVRRRKAEVALGGSEERYRRLIQAVREYAIWMMTSEGEIRTWNTGAERMTRCPAGEAIGQNFARFFSAADIKRGRPQEILRLAAEGDIYEDQGILVRKDGTRFLVRSTITASRDEYGRLRGFSGVAGDLSESAELEAKFRGLMEAAPDAMVVANAGGEIVLVNVQAEKQFGYRRDELLGRKFTSIVPVGFAESLSTEDLNSPEPFATRRIGTGAEISGRRKDGSEFPIEMMLSPLESPEGLLITAAIRDITERKEESARIVRLKDEFVATVSHELRTPLTSIAGALALLVNGAGADLSSTTMRLLTIAYANSLRLVRLVNSILAMEKIESGQVLFSLRCVDIRAVVLQVIEDNQPLAGPFGVNIVLSSDSVGLKIRTDPDWVIQIVTNLLSNAVKFSPAGGCVELSVEDLGGRARISVRDQGPGVPEEFKSRIFEKFAQADGSDARRKGGTGLGLSIVKEIVSRLRGEVGFEDAPGGGAIFYVDLPCAAQAAADHEPQTDAARTDSDWELSA